MKFLSVLAACLILVGCHAVKQSACSLDVLRGHPPKVPQAIKDSWPGGVNVHIHETSPLDQTLLKDLGPGIIRTGFVWEWVEHGTPGSYDPGYLDRLTAEARSADASILMIVSGVNTLYDPPHPAASPLTEQAFLKCLAWAVARYRSEPIIWEVWNEPNLAQFWEQDQAATGREFARFARDVAITIRAVDPDATIVAPALAGVDKSWLKDAYRAGLLDVVDAVSIHPYRDELPESLAQQVAQLQMDMCETGDRCVPVVVSEWGYWNDLAPAYLPRAFATCALFNVPMMIWYDWRADPGNYTAGRESELLDPDFGPTRLFPVAQTWFSALRGRPLDKALKKGPIVYLGRFSGDSGTVYVGWTTGPAYVWTPDFEVGEIWDSLGQPVEYRGGAIVLSGQVVYVFPR